MKQVGVWVVALALTAGSSACTHTMQVKNLNEYSKSASLSRHMSFDLVDNSISPDEHEYFEFIHEALATRPDVTKVVVASPSATDTPADVRVKIEVRPKYNGSGWNFPITFPGFVVFAHAWNGFVYSADLATDVDLSLAGAAESTHQEFDTHYDMRHCDFWRGALASSGWYTPGFGGLNLLWGIILTEYDNDATPPFRKEVRSAYGQFIANSIVEMANKQVQASLASAPTRAAGTEILPKKNAAGHL